MEIPCRAIMTCWLYRIGCVLLVSKFYIYIGYQNIAYRCNTAKKQQNLFNQLFKLILGAGIHTHTSKNQACSYWVHDLQPGAHLHGLIKCMYCLSPSLWMPAWLPSGLAISISSKNKMICNDCSLCWKRGMDLYSSASQ